MKRALLVLLLAAAMVMGASCGDEAPDTTDTHPISTDESTAPPVVTSPDTKREVTDKVETTTDAEPVGDVQFDNSKWQVMSNGDKYTLRRKPYKNSIGFNLDSSKYSNIVFLDDGMHLIDTSENYGHFSYDDIFDNTPTDFPLYACETSESNCYVAYYCPELDCTIIENRRRIDKKPWYFYDHKVECSDFDGGDILIHHNSGGKLALENEVKDSDYKYEYKWNNILVNETLMLVADDGVYEFANRKIVKLDTTEIFDEYLLCVPTEPESDNKILQLRKKDGTLLQTYDNHNVGYELVPEMCEKNGDEILLCFKKHYSNGSESIIKYLYPMPTCDDVLNGGELLYNSYERFVLYNGRYFVINGVEDSDNFIKFADIDSKELQPKDIMYIDDGRYPYIWIIDKNLNTYKVDTWDEGICSDVDITPFDELRLHGNFAGFKYAGDGDEIGIVADGDNNFIMKTDGDIIVVGDFLITYSYPCHRSSYVVYNSNLERISTSTYDYHLFDDGRLLIYPNIRSDDNSISNPIYQIYSPSGELEFESREYDEVFSVEGGYICVNDNGIVKVIGINGNELAELFEWNENYRYDATNSGYYDKASEIDYPDGYYYTFEKRPYVSGGENGVEYCYIPETGEVQIFPISDFGAMSKPVLYLYPTEPTDISVTFAHPELLTTVYPAYNSGWNVHADTDGTLTDGRRSYYALYWEEAMSTNRFNFTDGFCVTADNATAFLEEKLDAIGLTEREANEFIMYWLPILERNGISLVHFELTESREATNALQISPAPDSLLRVAMHIMKVDEVTDLPEQKLPHFERRGFVAVEWGGRNY
ncbi:MAG: hypothetical protein HFE63_05665 [Clostridiales bacterium]|nr:hypothetical protein [Clostridiales bacterium]